MCKVNIATDRRRLGQSPTQHQRAIDLHQISIRRLRNAGQSTRSVRCPIGHATCLCCQAAIEFVRELKFLRQGAKFDWITISRTQVRRDGVLVLAPASDPNLTMHRWVLDWNAVRARPCADRTRRCRIGRTSQSFGQGVARQSESNVAAAVMAPGGAASRGALKKMQHPFWSTQIQRRQLVRKLRQQGQGLATFAAIAPQILREAPRQASEFRDEAILLPTLQRCNRKIRQETPHDPILPRARPALGARAAFENLLSKYCQSVAICQIRRSADR